MNSHQPIDEFFRFHNLLMLSTQNTCWLISSNDVSRFWSSQLNPTIRMRSVDWVTIATCFYFYFCLKLNCLNKISRNVLIMDPVINYLVITRSLVFALIKFIRGDKYMQVVCLLFGVKLNISHTFHIPHSSAIVGRCIFFVIHYLFLTLFACCPQILNVFKPYWFILGRFPVNWNTVLSECRATFMFN